MFGQNTRRVWCIFVEYGKRKAMTNGIQYRSVGNTGVVSRYKQVIILVAIIAACIAISMLTESKSSNGLSTSKAAVLNN